MTAAFPSRDRISVVIPIPAEALLDAWVTIGEDSAQGAEIRSWMAELADAHHKAGATQNAHEHDAERRREQDALDALADLLGELRWELPASTRRASLTAPDLAGEIRDASMLAVGRVSCVGCRIWVNRDDASTDHSTPGEYWCSDGCMPRAVLLLRQS